MGVPFTRLKGQDLAEQQVVPMLFFPLDGSNDATTPGVLQMFRGDEDGNLLVTIGGAASLSILLADDADSVAEIATADRLPTVARLYGLDGETEADFDRIRTDDDAIEAQGADSKPALRTMVRPRLYQNSDDVWQRQKGQGADTIAPSASRTVTTIFGSFLNTNWRAAHYIVDVTVIPGGSITINIEGRDIVSLVFYPLLISAPIVAVGTTVLKVGIGFTPVALLTSNDMIPYITRVNVVAADASAITYSIGANYSV